MSTVSTTFSLEALTSVCVCVSVRYSVMTMQFSSPGQNQTASPIIYESLPSYKIIQNIEIQYVADNILNAGQREAYGQANTTWKKRVGYGWIHKLKMCASKTLRLLIENKSDFQRWFQCLLQAMSKVDSKNAQADLSLDILAHTFGQEQSVWGMRATKTCF